jgi:non-heme chloroperoxidase
MRVVFVSLIGLALAPSLAGQAIAPLPAMNTPKTTTWQDPSPHKVTFVTVDKDVRLEVLDWGGSGRPLVLLAGLGNTAHIFDDFAPKLAARYHVYGVTRRGFGNSSSPTSGYSADRLGDDVLAVLDFLKLERPILVGHSIAGEELSSIGTRHPERVAGLIYLDAAYSFGYYDPDRGDFQIDLNDLQKKLELLQRGQSKQQIQDLLQTDLPRFEQDLRSQQAFLDLVGMVPPSFFTKPSATDLANFQAFRAYMATQAGVPFPEAELRQQHQANPDGSVGPDRTQPYVGPAIQAGEQKYSDIHVPILTIYAIPRDSGPAFKHLDPEVCTKLLDYEVEHKTQDIKTFETANPSARIVRLPHAKHGVFLSNEADVLREIDAFISRLPQ